MSAVEWLLHYHELNGKTDREEILKYFKHVHIQFKGETDLQTAFDSIVRPVWPRRFALGGCPHPAGLRDHRQANSFWPDVTRFSPTVHARECSRLLRLVKAVSAEGGVLIRFKQRYRPTYVGMR